MAAEIWHTDNEEQPKQIIASSEHFSVSEDVLQMKS